jgi:hypothetical protein
VDDESDHWSSVPVLHFSDHAFTRHWVQLVEANRKNYGQANR